MRVPREKLSDVWFAVTEILRQPIIDGVQLNDIELTTTAVRVPHRLGRKVRGYVVVRSNAGVTVFDDNDGKLDLDKFLYLQSSAPVTVNLWVF